MTTQAQGRRKPRKREMAMCFREQSEWDKAKRQWRTEIVPLTTVRVMARAEGYAMVRTKGAMPFVCKESLLVAL